MSKILLRIIGVLLILHGSVTFVAAKFLPISSIGDRLLFAQHGFTFIFLALLNLVFWPLPVRGTFFRWTVHLSNLVFFLFYVAIPLRNSETPNIVSTSLVGALFLIGLVLDRSKKSGESLAP